MVIYYKTSINSGIRPLRHNFIAFYIKGSRHQSSRSEGYFTGLDQLVISFIRKLNAYRLSK